MQIMSVAICLMISGAHMNISFIMKVNILMLINWSYRPPLPNHVHYWGYNG